MSQAPDIIHKTKWTSASNASLSDAWHLTNRKDKPSTQAVLSGPVAVMAGTMLSPLTSKMGATRHGLRALSLLHQCPKHKAHSNREVA